jgi:hypothetical protein
LRKLKKFPEEMRLSTVPPEDMLKILGKGKGKGQGESARGLRDN